MFGGSRRRGQSILTTVSPYVHIKYKKNLYRTFVLRHTLVDLHCWLHCCIGADAQHRCCSETRLCMPDACHCHMNDPPKRRCARAGIFESLFGVLVRFIYCIPVLCKMTDCAECLCHNVCPCVRWLLNLHLRHVCLNFCISLSHRWFVC